TTEYTRTFTDICSRTELLLVRQKEDDTIIKEIEEFTTGRDIPRESMSSAHPIQL
ncbi:unnamed protein product, partial [Allacma fusca]